jgi:Outer membrane protein beta-barrel domain
MLMKRISGSLLAILTIGACAVSTAALADNLAGFYVGAGVGYSTIRSDDSAYGLPGYYNDHQTAWKAIVGVRPLPIVGAEFEYIDFGQPGGHRNYDPNYYGRDSHPRAAALFAVGYLPLPIPLFDVYGKAGVARLRTDVTTFVPNCATPAYCAVPGTSIRQAQTDNRFAYGVGVQSKWWGVSFRAEYERISSQYGDPDAVTVSATWTF